MLYQQIHPEWALSYSGLAGLEKVKAVDRCQQVHSHTITQHNGSVFSGASTTTRICQVKEHRDCRVINEWWSEICPRKQPLSLSVGSGMTHLQNALSATQKTYCNISIFHHPPLQTSAFHHCFSRNNDIEFRMRSSAWLLEERYFGFMNRKQLNRLELMKHRVCVASHGIKQWTLVQISTGNTGPRKGWGSLPGPHSNKMAQALKTP